MHCSNESSVPFCAYTQLCACRYDELVAAGMQPDLVTVNTLLKSCMRCSNADRAAALWEDMLGRGMEPDTYTLNMVVKVSVGVLLGTVCTCLVITYAAKHDVAARCWLHIVDQMVVDRMVVDQIVVDQLVVDRSSTDVWVQQRHCEVGPNAQMHAGCP